MFAAYKTAIARLWNTKLFDSAPAHRFAFPDEMKDLPAFVTRSSGWLRSYQSWTKKRHSHTAAKVCITRFNNAVNMVSCSMSQAC